MRIVSACLGLLTIAAVGGCSQDKSPPLTPASGKAEPSSSAAIHALSNAQCDHESRCGRVGADRKYFSREHCTTQISKKLRGKLSDCSERVDEDDVRQCVGEIKKQGCSNVVDEFQAFVACKADDLCD